MLLPTGISCSTSRFEGSGRSAFKAARAVFTEVVEVKELRLTSEIGTPNSTMRTTELGFAASDGARTKRTRSPAVELFSNGRTPPGRLRKFAKSREVRYSVKFLNPFGSRAALALNSRQRCKPRFQV